MNDFEVAVEFILLGRSQMEVDIACFLQDIVSLHFFFTVCHFRIQANVWI